MHGCLYWGWEEFTYDLSWSCSQDISHDCSHLKAGLELEDLLPWWLTHGCWLEASVHHWLLAEDCYLGYCRASLVFLWEGSWLPLEQVMRERERERERESRRYQGGSHNAFFWTSLESDTLSFLPCSIHQKRVTTSGPHTRGGQSGSICYKKRIKF